MKRLFWKSATFVRVLSMGIIILVSTSCSSTKSMPVVQSNDTTSFIQRSARVDTVYLRDSVFVSEKMRGDTVYLTRVEWRDRWRTRVERDTVMDVRVEKEVVQLPPERYVPPFYKRCTIALWAIIAITTIVVIGRFAIGRLRIKQKLLKIRTEN